MGTARCMTNLSLHDGELAFEARLIDGLQQPRPQVAVDLDGGAEESVVELAVASAGCATRDQRIAGAILGPRSNGSNQ